MNAAEIFARAAVDVFEVLGVPVIYTPAAGSTIVIQALIHSIFNAQPSGMGAATWAQQATAEFQFADIPTPRQGDTITVDLITYTLAAEIENNGVMMKWMLE